MAKTQVTLMVKNGSVDILIMPEGNKNRLEIKSVKTKKGQFNEDYYTSLREGLTQFSTENPTLLNPVVTLVIPDSLVAMDTISIPSMRGLKTTDLVNTNIKTLYKNSNDLKFNSTLLASTKQASVFSVSILRQDIYMSFYKACAAAKLTPETVTFASSTVSNSIMSINSKLKNASFILLDFDRGSSNFVFVNKGKTVGFYRLPFGYEVLSETKVYSDDMVFNHYSAELAVLNAKERAKAKKFTEDESIINENNEETGEDGEENFEETNNVGIQQFSSLPRRQVKKTPKFLMRPTPVDEQDYIYENFRLFEKWALNLVRSNETLMTASSPEAIYVNLPDDYSFLFGRVNEEKDENGILFAKLDLHGEKEIVTNNLGLYGGLLTSQFNKNNNF